MGQFSNYKINLTVALGLVSLVFLMFAIAGAGSGLAPLPEFEPSTGGPGGSEFEPSGDVQQNEPRFPLNPTINWTWFFGTLAGITILSFLLFAYLAWRRPRFGPDYHAPLEEDPHEREFNELVHLLGQDKDLDRSVRLIFEAAETKIEHLPKRVYPETPFEWSARICSSHPHLGQPLDQLCDSYAKSRFGSEPTTNYERDVALQALRELRHLSNSVVVAVPKVPVLPWT